MNLELLAPYTLVAYTLWATPGPNNMMLVYSGARFGVLASAPHIAGIIAGTCLLNAAAITGLNPLIERWPVLLTLLKILGSSWLLLIGWKMARAQLQKTEGEVEKPMRFVSAALFQFANPKAITATLALVSLAIVALEQDSQLIWPLAALIPPLSLLSILPWVLAGRAIRRFLSTPLRWQLFRYTTGGLTASCALFLWI